MQITASMVKELREKSGAGMMECKKALVETDGDFEKAVEELRKKGLAKANKKSGRVVAEGVISVTNNGNSATFLEINCETDFVTKNEQFLQMVTQLSAAASSFDSQDVEEFKNQPYPDSSKNIGDELVEQVATIGENIQCRRIAKLKVDNGEIVHYIHNAIPGQPNFGKIAVAVALQTNSKDAEISAFGKQVAMHIAASNPKSLDVESLDQKLVEKEANFLKEQAAGSGKPENVIEKMVEGRIRKFYEEIVLLEQISMLEGKTKIKDLLADLAKKIGEDIKITGFIRYEVGEGVEKKEENFAEEVQKMTTA